MIVIGISENAIIFLGVKILIDKSEIADYLTKAKKLIVQNKHVQFQHEWLYIFGKEISLMKRYEEKSEVVPLYIKFNMIENKFVIVISFHKQKYPLVYYFR